jgi:hypothetical protein
MRAAGLAGCAGCADTQACPHGARRVGRASSAAWGGDHLWGVSSVPDGRWRSDFLPRAEASAVCSGDSGSCGEGDPVSGVSHEAVGVGAARCLAEDCVWEAHKEVLR